MIEVNQCLWFYEKDGEEAGPIQEAELLQLLKAGTVFPDTLLWTEKMVGWQPALELEPFRSALRDGESVWTPAPRPWVRFWARMVDLSIYEAMALGVLLRTGEDVAEANAVTWLFMILWTIMLEASLLSWSGTTIGKWLFHISLSRPNGERLDFNASLYRTFMVWLRGLAFQFPLINFITMAVGYRNLVVNQESTWDRDGGTIVRHRKVSPIRWVGAFLILVTFTLSYMVVFESQILEQLQKMEAKSQRVGKST